MERREFVRNTTGAAAWTALSASRILGANDRVMLGIIGCGGRGRTVMREMLRAPGAELAATCDVYDANAARANQDLAGGRAKTAKDFRHLLDMRELDAVQISTPDHWHAIPTVLALEAGKHVYVEKPFALTVREGRAMVEATAALGAFFIPARSIARRRTSQKPRGWSRAARSATFRWCGSGIAETSRRI